MNKNIHLFLRHLFIFITVAATIGGIHVRNGAFGYIVTGAIFALAMMFVPSVIKFFKLPVNFSAQILIGTLVSILIFFSYRYLVLGFIDFGGTVLGGNVGGLVELPRVELDKLGTVLYGALIASLLSAIMQETGKKSN
ncbi:hypothetical protein JW796_02505 [Candidatus Dojkabacteria bacterium]|nr:hypothetical protein [Candidatus Dojkabacteria bacterium]